MKHDLFNQTIQLFLVRETLTDPSAKREEAVPLWIRQRAEVGSVHLSVPTELAEVDIHKCRIQKGGESLRYGHWQAGSSNVVIVQMVLKCDSVGWNTSRVVNRGHNSTPLLLSCESLDEDIVASRNEEIFRAGV
jgi:hypothetical protein